MKTLRDLLATCLYFPDAENLREMPAMAHLELHRYNELLDLPLDSYVGQECQRVITNQNTVMKEFEESMPDHITVDVIVGRFWPMWDQILDLINAWYYG